MSPPRPPSAAAALTIDPSKPQVLQGIEPPLPFRSAEEIKAALPRQDLHKEVTFTTFTNEAPNPCRVSHGDSTQSLGAALETMSQHRGAYMGQQPIFDHDCESPVGDRGAFASLEAHLKYPAVRGLRPEDAVAANIWMNFGEVTPETEVHFDAWNGFLYVLWGAKEVCVAPPGAILTADHAQETGPFHEISTVHYAKESLFRMQHEGVQRFVLNAGDALWLPEGWWHQIRSEPGTGAMNIWWPGVGGRISSKAKSDPASACYLLRVAAVAAVEAKADAKLKAAMDLSTAARPIGALDSIEARLAAMDVVLRTYTLPRFKAFMLDRFYPFYPEWVEEVEPLGIALLFHRYEEVGSTPDTRWFTEFAMRWCQYAERVEGVTAPLVESRIQGIIRTKGEAWHKEVAMEALRDALTLGEGWS